MLRAQSSASRLVWNVLMVDGQPCLRMIAFQVFEGVLVMVATTLPVQVYRKCPG